MGLYSESAEFKRALQRRRQEFAATLREFARQSQAEGRNDDANTQDFFITNRYEGNDPTFIRGKRGSVDYGTGDGTIFFSNDALNTTPTKKKNMILQRDPTYLDPLARYFFAMEQDRHQKFLSKTPSYTGIRRNAGSGELLTDEHSPDTRIHLPGIGNINTDVNINFNLGSLELEVHNVNGQRIEEIRLRGMSRAQAIQWQSAMRGQTAPADIAGHNGIYDQNKSKDDVADEGARTYLVFDSQFKYGSNSDQDFNFAQELVTLAKQGATDPFVAFNPAEGQRDWRDFFPTDTAELRNLYGGEAFPVEPLATGGTDSQTILVGGRNNPYVGRRMSRILSALDMTLSEFETAYPFWQLGRSAGRLWQESYHRIRDREDNTYGNNFKYISAVIDWLYRNVNEAVALRAANAALTEDEKTAITFDLPPLTYDFYDFETSTQVVEDGISSILELMPARQTSRVYGPNGRVPGLKNIVFDGKAYIKPEYNFTLADYESAVLNDYVPEAALPNLYVYDLATNTRLPGRQHPSWDTSEGRELAGRFDKLVTLNELVRGTLPTLNTGFTYQSMALRGYLTSYANAVRDEGVVVDTLSDVARSHYNIDSDLNGQDIYKLTYPKRKNFPMYIEIGIPIFNTFKGAVKEKREADDANQQRPTTPGDILGLGFESSFLVRNIRSAFEQDTTRQDMFLARTTGVKRAGNLALRDRLEGESQEDYDAYVRLALNSPGAAAMPQVIMKKNLKVADFDDWLENLDLDDIEGEFATFVGAKSKQKRGSGRNSNAFENWLSLNARNFSVQNMVMYEDFITGRKSLCESETIMLKLVKHSVADNGNKTVLQNFYFPNFRKKFPPEGEGDENSRLRGRPPLVDVVDEVIQFVDTQVKYDKQYYYELVAYDIVYGSTFEFRTRTSVFPDANTPPAANSLAFFSFNVNTKPNIKIVEYPIISDLFKERTRRQTRDDLSRDEIHRMSEDELEQIRTSNFGGYPIGRTLQEAEIGGVAYPKSKIKDLPPLPPEANIFGYQGIDNKVLINLAPTVGRFTGRDALPYIAFDDEEAAALAELSRNQVNANPSVPSGKIQYVGRTEGIVKMLIYRTEEMNTSVPNFQDLYKNFSGKLHKVLDLSQNATRDQKAMSYDFIDDLEPNRKYYYTFRIRNYRDAEQGNMSNPTAIYEVELKNENGFQTAFIQEYLPVLSSNRTPSKKMARFIEIKASDLMSDPITEISPSDGYLNSREGQFIARRSMLDHEGELGILTQKHGSSDPGKQFIIRLTSRDTGKKIDIAVDFRRKQDIIKE